MLTFPADLTSPVAITLAITIGGLLLFLWNRIAVEVVATDDLSGGSHAISLEGDRAAVTHHYPLKRLAPGRYVVAAILRRSDGSEVRRESFVTVLGVGGPDLFGAGAPGAAAGGSAER